MIDELGETVKRQLKDNKNIKISEKHENELRK